MIRKLYFPKFAPCFLKVGRNMGYFLQESLYDAGSPKVANKNCE